MEHQTETVGDNKLQIGMNLFQNALAGTDQRTTNQRRLRGQLIEVFKYLNRFTTASARGLFDYDLNDRTRNNGAKLTVKHFNTSAVYHFYSIKITTTWIAYQVKL